MVSHPLERSQAVLSQCKIMSNKHTRGTLPAFAFPVSNTLTWESTKYKSVHNISEGRSFVILPGWIPLRLVEGALPQYRAVLSSLLHGLLTQELNTFNFGQHRLKRHRQDESLGVICGGLQVERQWCFLIVLTPWTLLPPQFLWLLWYARAHAVTSVLLLCTERRETQQGFVNRKASECDGDS